MLSKYITALVGAVATVQALPADEVDKRSYPDTAAVETPAAKGFEVVIVYATPTNCPTKPTACPSDIFGLPAPSPSPYTAPSVKAPAPVPTTVKEGHQHGSGSGFKEKATPLQHDAPIETLRPGVHWSCDTKPATNVIPVEPTKGSEFYYGVTDPSKEGHYAFLKYFFKYLSVNLDHSDHVKGVEYGSGGLKVSFGSDEAFKYAVDSWKAGGEMILIAYAAGCGDYAKGDRCYFKVTTLRFIKGEKVVIADGEACHPDDIIDSGETEWGWWHPRPGYGGGKGHETKTLPGVGTGTTTTTSSVRTVSTSRPTTTTSPGASFSWEPSTSSSSAPGGGEWSSSGAGPSASGFPSESGFPSASGSAGVSASASASGSIPSASADASSASASGSGSPSSSGVPEPSSADFSGPRAGGCDAPEDTVYGLPVACLGDYFDLDLDENLGVDKISDEYKNFLDEFNPLEYGELSDDDFEWRVRRRVSNVKKRWGLPSLGSVGSWIKKTATNLYEGAKDLTSLSASVNKELSWKLPDASSEDENAKTLKDGAKQVTSPWGDSILLKAFGSQEADDDKKLNGYMNVFCVGCGVSGSARVAGKAKFGLTGISEGVVSLNTDVQFVLKLGIDAQMTYKQEFSQTLLDVGLPGLSYGVVTIGPRITVGSRVELEAEAKGKLLAGAEMGLQNAHVSIDFINPGNSQQGGWEPYFKPVFEAEGELMMAATLGLPIGIKCGLQISSWDKSVGLIDEPSIKGVAQVAASIGLDDNNKFSAGFKDIDGCTGISTQISWRNRLFIDVLGSQKSLLDTSDRPLARGCVALPGRPTPSGSPSGTPSASALPSASAQPSQPSVPSPSPSSPAGGDDEEGNGETPGGNNGGSTPGSGNGGSTPGTPVTPGKIIDLTSKINSTGSSVVSYSPQPFGNKPYNMTNGFDFALIVDQDVTTMIIGCSNGNVYAASIETEDNPDCSEMWAAKEDILMADGAQRVLHYYTNSMDVVGVSRLRLESKDRMPGTGVPIAFVPFSDAEDVEEGDETDDYYYLAVDPYENVFYPLVCDYEDEKIGSKLFLAMDPELGTEELMKEELMYTVTGGKVTQCYQLTLNQGAYAEGDDWMTGGETSDEDWEWDLEDDWWAEDDE